MYTIFSWQINAFLYCSCDRLYNGILIDIVLFVEFEILYNKLYILHRTHDETRIDIQYIMIWIGS